MNIRKEIGHRPHRPKPSCLRPPRRMRSPGDAVYLGPTFFWKIAPKVLMSAAWEAQVAGREIGVSSALDLTDFPAIRRHR